MAIEWIQLDVTEIMALCTYDTYVHKKSGDTILLDEFVQIGDINVCEINEGFHYRVYWCRQSQLDSAIEAVEIDKAYARLPFTNNWWEVDEEDLKILYENNSIFLKGTCYNLNEFKLSMNEYGKDIFYLDSPEWRFFFFKSNWRMLIEEDYQ